MYSFKEMYEKTLSSMLPLDMNKIVKKWSPIIKDKVMEFDNEFVLKEMCKFSEVYQSMEKNMPSVASLVGVAYGSSFPEDYIQLPEAIKMIYEGVDDFIVNDVETKMNIVHDYYNAVTGKKGYLLENGIRVEDGRFLDKKNQEKIDMELKKTIDRRIDFVLSPDKRIILEREKKLKRIVKNRK